MTRTKMLLPERQVVVTAAITINEIIAKRNVATLIITTAIKLYNWTVRCLVLLFIYVILDQFPVYFIKHGVKLIAKMHCTIF